METNRVGVNTECLGGCEPSRLVGVHTRRRKEKVRAWGTSCRPWCSAESKTVTQMPNGLGFDQGGGAHDGDPHSPEFVHDLLTRPTELFGDLMNTRFSCHHTSNWSSMRRPRCRTRVRFHITLSTERSWLTPGPPTFSYAISDDEPANDSGANTTVVRSPAAATSPGTGRPCGRRARWVSRS